MKLFAFGSNGSGQLGIGHTEDVSSPSQCLFALATKLHDDEIVHIAAGGNHTLLLTKQGYVYAAGCNSDGRCGPDLQISSRSSSQPNDQESQTENDENLLRFRRVVLTDSITGSEVDIFKCVSATWEGSVLVASVRKSNRTDDDKRDDNDDNDSAYEDRVFVLGSTPKGELGLGSSVDPVRPVTPGTFIPDFPPEGTRITAVASGMGHSVAILSDGAVYGWGASRKGQLGEALKAQKIVWAPWRVEGVPFKATGAVCGREFTVALGQRDRGELAILGDKANRWGVLDVPDYLKSLSEPSSGRAYTDIGASWHGIYVHAAPVETLQNTSLPAGSLIAWGRNDRGQLPPPDLPSPVKIAVGSEHVVALLQDGSVATFGWGEHGNCGPNTDSRGNVSGMYNTIYLPDSVYSTGGRISGIGAGCATSWLIVR
ncbi:uncharacterized protein N7459_009159 [Penicillium hispanicum]|uniref:uncharacterized protein n=1 Tax=Penicillium hispanicum TaxID=1080232 RepID=UPI0025425E4A|nr:uncharacterized protein N7459_009159 [Penicillium hispanicum]KAJ5569729.1 hypothetical protein N7459_009159 [Penicillium hispanicum]